MADKSWKAFERRIAKLFGCTRRGPVFRSADGGTDDCTHAWYAIECKLLSRPTFGEMKAACLQAEASAATLPMADGRSREPVVVFKKKFDDDADALVIQRLATFKAWHL